MSYARFGGLIGLAGLGLCLSFTAPARAGQTDPLSIAPAPAGTGNVSDDCTFNGIKLAGKVKVVTSFPDVRVKAVSSFPDLKVKKVSSFADKCGEWQFVDSFADFKIQYVDSFPDVEVAWVESFPGLP
ncbi:MAG: hypothetical protein R6X02_23945 [Enhygromyxa sp.]